MEIVGKLVEILPSSSFNGKRGMVTRHGFVLETSNNGYVKNAKFDVYGDAAWAAMSHALLLGETIQVSFDVTSRKFKDNWYTSLDAWRAVNITGGMNYNPKNAEKEKENIESDEPSDGGVPF